MAGSRDVGVMDGAYPRMLQFRLGRDRLCTTLQQPETEVSTVTSQQRVIFPLLLATALGLGLLAAAAAEPQKIVNNFDKDREGWQIYDYNGGKQGGGNVFFPATWEKTGGVRDTGYIWADDSRWRIDTPENPHSIL